MKLVPPLFLATSLPLAGAADAAREPRTRAASAAMKSSWRPEIQRIFRILRAAVTSKFRRQLAKQCRVPRRAIWLP